MKRIFEITPSWDKQKDPRGNFGISDAIMWLGVKDNYNKHAVVINIHTGWYLESINQQKGDLLNKARIPSLYTISYHCAVEPDNVDNFNNDNYNDNCEWLDTPCRFDVESAHTKGLVELLVSKGSEAVYEKLEELYIERFCKVSEDEGY